MNDKIKAVRVMGEWESTGIWLVESVSGFRHVMLQYDTLGMPRQLAQEFEEWSRGFGMYTDWIELVKFEAKGFDLAVKLKCFLGDAVTVLYAGESNVTQDVEISGDE